MFEGMLGGLINKEKAIYDTIQVSLESLSEELNCSMGDFFIMIKPTNEKGDFKLWVYKDNKKIREIPLKEIIAE